MKSSKRHAETSLTRLKDPVPHISKGDFKEHLKKHPLTNLERALYLIKTGQTKESKFQKLGDSDVNELMREAQMINGSQNEISKVYRKCKNLGGTTARQQARQRLHQ